MLALLPGFAAAATADSVTGPAQASAAETVVVGGTRFRLEGSCRRPQLRHAALR